MCHGNTLRTLELAGAGVGTVTEAEFVHLGNHSLCTPLGLRTTLRKKSKRADTGSHEKHCRTVLTGSNTSTATNASGCIHTLFSLVVRNEGIVGILSRTGANRNESTCLKDLVKRATVNNEVLDNRESGTAPRLDSDGCTILEMTHKELTGSHVVIWTVSAAIDVE